MTAWQNHEDVDKDLWLFSEISLDDVDKDEPATAPLLQWNARIGANHNVSIFDADLPHEDVTYVSSGRGRGGVSKIFRPGLPVRESQEDEEDIKRRLREVSGLGYSNELIEKQFKKNVPTPPLPSEVEFCDIQEEDYCPSSSKSPITLASSPVPSKNGYSRNSTPGIPSELTKTGKCKTPETKSHPPPLSVILKRGKKKPISISEENISKEKPIAIGSTLRADAPEFRFKPKVSLESSPTPTLAISSSEKEPKISSNLSDMDNPLDDSNISPNLLYVEKSSNGPGSSRSEKLSWRKSDNTRKLPSPSTSTYIPPWRRRENEISSTSERDSLADSDNEYTARGSLLWWSPNKDRNFDNRSDSNSSCGSYRQAALSNNAIRRDFARRDNIFDLNSNHDFPAL